MEYMVECSVVVELMDFLEMGMVGNFWVDSRDAIASKKSPGLNKLHGTIKSLISDGHCK